MAPLVALSCGEFDKFKGSNKVYSSQWTQSIGKNILFSVQASGSKTLNRCIDKLLQLDCGLQVENYSCLAIQRFSTPEVLAIPLGRDAYHCPLGWDADQYQCKYLNIVYFTMQGGICLCFTRIITVLSAIQRGKDLTSICICNIGRRRFNACYLRSLVWWD